MASRDLKVLIDADAAKFEAGMQRATAATMRMETQLRSADLAAADLDRQLAAEGNRAAQQRADSMQKLGRGLMIFGAATVAGLGLAAKAAINWESAWAGVRKTVDGSPEELAALEGELRQLAETLPATHAEIAGVAEAAGQLGVQRDAIAGFTKVMIDLGETTNLSAEEAATAIAQLGNVIGLDLKNDVDNFGATLVALGNDGASTEADILSMAQRIGGAAGTIGMSAQDVLGFAAALSNVGIEAEAGGSSISRVMIDIAQAVDTGGEKLTTFAEVAGMSTAEFTAAFEADPARAIAGFIEGLGGIDAAGGSVFQTLQDLGLSEIRVRDALLRLSQSVRGVSTDLDLADSAWADNTALIEEAEKRYETTAAKMEMARNTLVNLAIDVGGVLLPAIAQVVESGANLVRWFNDLPGPVKTVVTWLGAVAGVGSLLAGSFLLLAPRIAAANAVMLTLARTSPVLAGGLMTVGSALSKLMLGLGAIGLVAGAVQLLKMTSEDFSVGAGQAAEGLKALNDGVSNELIDNIVRLHGELDSADKILGIIPRHLDGFTTSGKEAAEINDEWAASLSAVDEILATMVSSGDLDAAAASVEQLGDKLGLSGDELDAFVEEHLPLYVDGLAGARAANEDAAEGVDVATAALEDQAAAAGMTKEAFEEATKAVEDLLKRWSENLAGAVQPLAAWEAANQSAAEAAADAAGAGAEAWQEFADESIASIESFIAELEAQVTAQQDFATNVATIAQRGFAGLATALMEAGPEAAGLVAELVDGTDAELARVQELWPKSTADGMAGVAAEMRKWIPIAAQVAAEHGAGVAAEIGAGIVAGTTTVDEALAALNLRIEENVPGQITTKVDLDPSDFYLEASGVSADIAALNEGHPLPTVGLETSPFYGGLGDVNSDLTTLNDTRPVPLVDLDTSNFDAGTEKTTRALDSLDREKPTPRADLHLTRFLEQNRRANGVLRDFHRERPTPRADLNIEGVKRGRGLAQKEIDRLRGKTVDARANAVGRGAVDGLAKAVRGLRSKTITVTVQTKNVGSLPKNARGTDNFPGGLTWVGEEGPEIVALPRGSAIHSASESQRIASEAATASTFTGAAAGSVDLQDLLRRTAQQVVMLGDVTAEDWQTLLRLGWTGRAGDGMEALYPPLRITGQEFIRFGEVTNAEWRALLAMGWQGKAGDHMEALYRPMRHAADAFEQLAQEAQAAANQFGDHGKPGGKAPLNLTQLFARDLMAAMKAGKRIEEDLSWKGMDKRWTDDIREVINSMFYQANPGFDFGQSSGFAQLLTELLQGILGGAGARSGGTLGGRSAEPMQSTWMTTLPMASSPVGGGMPSSVTLDPGALAAALDGMSMTLMVDGQPMRGVMRSEITAHDRSVKRAVGMGASRTGASR